MTKKYLHIVYKNGSIQRFNYYSQYLRNNGFEVSLSPELQDIINFMNQHPDGACIVVVGDDDQIKIMRQLTTVSQPFLCWDVRQKPKDPKIETIRYRYIQGTTDPPGILQCLRKQSDCQILSNR